MTFRVRCFARLRDLTGADTLSVELPPAATVGELRRRAAADYPPAAGLIARCAVAVNGDFADDALTLPLDAEIALLPPVSGGA
jgi:molybdopterin synthase catalytic subunit